MISQPPGCRKYAPMKHSSWRSVPCLFAGILACLTGSFASAQLTQDQQAEMLFNSARKAYNEKNFTFAQGKFREFLTKFGGHKDVPAARYGLALTLIDGPEKKYDEARDIMVSLAAAKDFADNAMMRRQTTRPNSAPKRKRASPTQSRNSRPH